ncbi:TRAP transporter small permease [Rhodophyticola sp. CCM32]|uniref:TRAP transporter small permease n=1 Tax=Rhodophyticola sp. CCM32 TaxID=2916397 RepID=UPI00143DE613|nr:TRAP transporter small permease [Rhodophyticola sp. CCM32]
MKLYKWLGNAEFAVVGLLMIAMVVLVVVAVFMRYVVVAPLIFSFDLSTLLFAWIVFLGLALAERNQAHLAVTVAGQLLPSRAARVLRLTRQLLLIVVSIFVTWYGWKLFQRAGMTIPSMRISIGWLYASLPIGFALLTLAQIVTFARILICDDFDNEATDP